MRLNGIGQNIFNMGLSSNGETWKSPRGTLKGMLRGGDTLATMLTADIQIGDLLQRSNDNGQYLVVDTTQTTGSLHAAVSRCKHFVGVRRALDGIRDSFGRPLDASCSELVAEQVPLVLKSRNLKATDPSNKCFAVTFETSAAFDIRTGDVLEGLTETYLVLAAAPIPDGILEIYTQTL